jgi:hypothetical protein
MVSKFGRGAVPYGWRRDENGVLVEHKEEQRIIEQMRQYRLDGATLRSIKSGMGLDMSIATIARIVACVDEGKNG